MRLKSFILNKNSTNKTCLLYLVTSHSSFPCFNHHKVQGQQETKQIK